MFAFLSTGTNTFTELERSMARVERVLEYTALPPEEAPLQLKVCVVCVCLRARLINFILQSSKPSNASDLSLEAGFSSSARPTARAPANWPSSKRASIDLSTTILTNEAIGGKLEFRGVGMRYNASGEKALHDVSFTIPPRTKVGVVGRTGAGKSSLATALFRLVEICDGAILIDDVELASLPLRESAYFCV
jgi:ABC-type multidrug transport system fused ATPase/permease subunit